jgi:tripartite-type tricarboxylate transporter receptor subunit TctC
VTKLPHRRQFLHLAAGAAALPFAPHVARAQAYPTRPVRMIVPYAPGGQNDAVARLIAQKLSDQLGRQFFVENLAGAGSMLGTVRAAQSARDGYTILVTDTALVVNPHLYSKVSYDVFRDFAAVSVAVTTTQVLTVTPSLPVHTVKELVQLVQSNRGKYSYASPGIGTPGHMMGELLRLSAGLDLIHVPFNGAGPAAASTIAGHTPIGFGSPASTIAQVNDGKLRALALASKKRLPALPDVPTMSEAGFPEVEGEFWVGMFVPSGSPADVIGSLNREIARAITAPDVKERLAALGFEPASMSLEELPANLQRETAKWAKLIDAARIKIE